MDDSKIIPVVIDENLRNQYDQLKGVLDNAQAQLKGEKDLLEDLRENFKGEEEQPDIKMMIDPIVASISDMEKSYQNALGSIKQVEDKIRSLIRGANGKPVVWRRMLLPIEPDKILTDTYSLDGDKIVITQTQSSLKEDE